MAYTSAEKPIPHWAKYQVVAHAEDGMHVKNFQGFVRADMEFRAQLGHPPVNYWMAYRTDLEGKSNEELAAIEAKFDLKTIVDNAGLFQAVDDWGRVITIQRVNVEVEV